MKRFKNIEVKNEEQLKAIKDQEESKYRYLLTRHIKKIDFNDVSCKNKLRIGSGKQYHYNFTIFLGLGIFAENIYNDNLSLKAVKIKQRNMEDMIRFLECYKTYRKQQKSTLLNAKGFYK